MEEERSSRRDDDPIGEIVPGAIVDDELETIKIGRLEIRRFAGQAVDKRKTRRSSHFQE